MPAPRNSARNPWRSTRASAGGQKYHSSYEDITRGYSYERRQIGTTLDVLRWCMLERAKQWVSPSLVVRPMPTGDLALWSSLIGPNTRRGGHCSHQLGPPGGATAAPPQTLGKFIVIIRSTETRRSRLSTGFDFHTSSSSHTPLRCGCLKLVASPHLIHHEYFSYITRELFSHTLRGARPTSPSRSAL